MAISKSFHPHQYIDRARHQLHMKVFKQGVELLSNFQISIRHTETKRASDDAEAVVDQRGIDQPIGIF
jgi:hypothetical protein